MRVEPEAAPKRPAQQPHAVGGLAANRAQQPNRGRAALVAFAVLVALRASVQQAFYGLLPKYFADLGFSPSEFGFMVGVISVALALGTMTGGILGDRYDQPKILLWSLLASAPFSWLILDTANVWFFFPLAFAAGFFIGVPHSILVVMAQRLLPGRQGLASGAILGFTFAAGAVGMGVAGPFADIFSLSSVLHVVALLPVLAAICAFFMRTRTPVTSAMAPAAGSAD